MKKLLMVGVSLMIILSLVACSKKEDDKKDDANKPGIEDNVDKDKQENEKDDDNKDEALKNKLMQIISNNRNAELNSTVGIVDSNDDQGAEITFEMLGIDEKDMSARTI